MIKSFVLLYNFSRKISSQAAKQLYLQKAKEDKSFKELLNEDKQSSLKHIENESYVPEPKRGDSRIPRVKEDLKETNPHIIFKEKLMKTMKNLDIRDAESFNAISTELKKDFFLMKKLSEEQEQFSEQVKIKKRKEELKDTFKSIVDMNIQPDEQYAEQIPYFNKLSNEEKFERIQDWNNRYDQLGKIDPYLLQRARTSKNIEEFIVQNFELDTKYFDELKIPGVVHISQILTNQACTVVWIHVNLVDVSENKEKKQYIKKLNQHCKKYSWKMCQDLGLKYGPEIRWVLSRSDEKTEEVKREIDKQAESIVEAELVERYKEGKIPRTISKSKFNEIVDELKTKKQYLASEATEPEIPSKKNEADNKNIRSKATQQDKKSAAEKFWDQL